MHNYVCCQILEGNVCSTGVIKNATHMLYRTLNLYHTTLDSLLNYSYSRPHHRRCLPHNSFTHLWIFSSQLLISKLELNPAPGVVRPGSGKRAIRRLLQLTSLYMHCNALHCTVLHCNAMHSTAMQQTLLHCIGQYLAAIPV